MTVMISESRRIGASPRVIIVMGVSGSGKSTIGQSLAARLDCAFIDGDDFHSAQSVAKMRAGIALTDDDRWPWLAKVGATGGDVARAGGYVIVACSALKKSYRDRIRDSAACTTIFVLLDVQVADLERRVAARVDHYMPTTLLASQLSLLERPGPEELAKSFEPSGDEDVLLREITAWLRLAKTDSPQAT